MVGSTGNHSQKNMEFDPKDDEGTFGYEWNIEDIYLLYHCVKETIRLWPGAPARPYEEQEHLYVIRDELYKAVLDYKFRYMDVDEWMQNFYFA